MRSPHSHGVVLGLVLAFVLTSSAEAAQPPAMPLPATEASGARIVLGIADSDRASSPAVRAAVSLPGRQAAAARRLQVAARNLRRTVDSVLEKPNDADFLRVIQAQFNRAELILAIRNARAVGLDRLARLYQRVLDFETARLNDSIAFSDVLRQATAYGEQVANKAHEDNPSLSPAVLGNIAVNAANWYGNDALLKVTLRAATRKSEVVYEIILKRGEDLDRRAYGLYRALSIGSRKTNIRYGGREGLHQLPDAHGGFNGGFIGLRRAAETSGKTSPAIDVKTADGTYIRIHVRSP
jgi:hypothetical protein